MQGKFIHLFLLCCAFAGFNSSCKRENNCTDPEASNYNSKIKWKVKHPTCTYPSFIKDLSFEKDDAWEIIPSKDASKHAKRSTIKDGFMPTDGESFLKCVPLASTGSISYSTLTTQSYYTNQHFKGLYFDYRIVGIAGPDSVLRASVSLSNNGNNASNWWDKTIKENASTFGGFPSIVIEKKDEYIDLDRTEMGYIAISSYVSAGTFTLEIDNIRLVPL
jgi:hypothetical protein